MAQQDPPDPSHALFDRFVSAPRCKEVQQSFAELCHHLEVDPRDYRHFYSKLKERLNYWKAKALWAKLDKRASHEDYQQGQICAKNKCLVLGAGPCGLRVAVELALLGAQVVVLEKRNSFSRNNVLHLWPYTIHDLRGLAAKKFYGKFCCGTLDHISIRQLQLILLKVTLLLGVEVHTGVEFKGLLEPQASGATGWRAELLPEGHPAAAYEFDVFISAGGGRFVPDGFKRKELRGKLAIGITANFINGNTAAEVQVAEISGVARIYNQKFFQELHTEMGIDLENIVYYKDDTHYFVMTAKKKSLLKMGVIKQDYSDAEQLLAPANVNQEALLRYARNAAHFSTGHCLPDLQFARNHGKPDVAMFDFTCMHRAENASAVRERGGRKLLIGLVGDCLVEPFWPLGTGIARGFLAAFDSAWMVRSWGKGVPHLQVLSERESVYQLLSQTTSENTSKNYSTYSIDPATRYPNVNLSSIKPAQVQHLCDFEHQLDTSRRSKKQKSKFLKRQESVGGLAELLSWCQQQTLGYPRVKVKDLSQSWRSGLALCALIHRFRPALIDVASLGEADAAGNNQLAFDLLEKELGVPPIMSGSDMASRGQIDRLSMVLYLTQIRNALSERAPPADQNSLPVPASKSLSLSKTRSAISFLNKLKHNSLLRRKERLAVDREEREEQGKVEEEVPVAPVWAPDSAPAPAPGVAPGSSEECCFCGGRLYVLERDSAEGKFFHRGCFTCHQCGTTLRQGGYSFHQHNGRFYCEMHSDEVDLGHRNPSTGTQDNTGDYQRDGENRQNGQSEERGVNRTPQLPSSTEMEGPSKLSLDPGPSKPTETHALTDQKDQAAPAPVEDFCAPMAPTNHHAEHQPETSGSEHPQNGDNPSCPVPAPRASYQRPPASPPVPKPRTVHLGTPQALVPTIRDEEEDRLRAPAVTPDDEGHKTTARAEGDGARPTPPDSRPKQSLRKLQPTPEEKTQLVSLSFSQDSDSETPASSSASSSSKPADGGEEEGYWSGCSGGPPLGGHMREQRNRRCFRRKGEPPGPPQAQHSRVRSKFSPWNLSSPRLSREPRFSVHNSRLGASGNVQPGINVSEDDVNGDDDDEDDEDLLVGNDIDFLDEQAVPSDPAEAEKLELLKMKTLERRAKMSELQRFTKAQSIQRRLEEIEVTFKELEENGVVLERALRGEAGGAGSPDMIDQWIDLVHQKNALVSEESDLMVASRQLELEDKQSMLDMELRRYMEIDDSEKSPEQQAAEEQVLQQMLEVVDMRNSLVSFLEEKRLKENEELHSVSLMANKRHSAAGAQVHWE